MDGIILFFDLLIVQFLEFNELLVIDTCSGLNEILEAHPSLSHKQPATCISINNYFQITNNKLNKSSKENGKSTSKVREKRVTASVGNTTSENTMDWVEDGGDG